MSNAIGYPTKRPALNRAATAKRKSQGMVNAETIASARRAARYTGV